MFLRYPKCALVTLSGTHALLQLVLLGSPLVEGISMVFKVSPDPFKESDERLSSKAMGVICFVICVFPMQFQMVIHSFKNIFLFGL